jgi:hypothetical protein
MDGPRDFHSLGWFYLLPTFQLRLSLAYMFFASCQKALEKLIKYFHSGN